MKLKRAYIQAPSSGCCRQSKCSYLSLLSMQGIWNFVEKKLSYYPYKVGILTVPVV